MMPTSAAPIIATCNRRLVADEGHSATAINATSENDSHTTGMSAKLSHPADSSGTWFTSLSRKRIAK